MINIKPWYYVYALYKDDFGNSTSSYLNLMYISDSKDAAIQYCQRANESCKGNIYYFWREVSDWED